MERSEAVAGWVLRKRRWLVDGERRTDKDGCEAILKDSDGEFDPGSG